MAYLASVFSSSQHFWLENNSSDSGLTRLEKSKFWLNSTRLHLKKIDLWLDSTLTRLDFTGCRLDSIRPGMPKIGLKTQIRVDLSWIESNLRTLLGVPLALTLLMTSCGLLVGGAVEASQPIGIASGQITSCLTFSIRPHHCAISNNLSIHIIGLIKNMVYL